MRSALLPFLAALSALCVCGCASQRKISALRSSDVSASLEVSDSGSPVRLDVKSHAHDTLKVRDSSGKEIYIMRAELDEDGEMVATDRIEAAVVVSSFKNVAERHGKVDLKFKIKVPSEMTDGSWQLRFKPLLSVLGETRELDPILITGERYRRAQLRGYQQYERFLSTIITDTSAFVRRRDLELFLERNIPQIFALKRDSSLVSDEDFASLYGVTQREAVEHYTDRLRRSINRRRILRKDRMFHKLVKVPIVTDGLRLDTVIRSDSGGVEYEYTQTIATRPSLSKAVIEMQGTIYEQDKMIYNVPPMEPLTFYISSIASFVDDSEHYIRRVVERKVLSKRFWCLDFKSGRHDIDPRLGGNARTIAAIDSALTSLLCDEEFVVDSIFIASFASPEGSVRANNALCARRASAAAGYFERYTRAVADSLARSAGVSLSLGDAEVPAPENSVPKLSFRSRSMGENWPLLDVLVERDTLLSAAQKEAYRALSAIDDLDRRERMMQRQPSYPHLRRNLYPLLRTVQFDFHLHRRGMVKDTVCTTELDTCYMRGVAAIKNRDYLGALSCLSSYADYNTAVAYLSLDRNRSALDILNTCPHTAKVDYMLAVVYSRMGDDQSAVQHYLDACASDASLVHRGNLDPEISSLVKRYSLKFEDDL